MQQHVTGARFWKFKINILTDTVFVSECKNVICNVIVKYSKANSTLSLVYKSYPLAGHNNFESSFVQGSVPSRECQKGKRMDGPIRKT